MRPRTPSADGIVDGFDFDARYRWGKIAVAWCAWGFVHEERPNVYSYTDADGEEYEIEDYEDSEMIADTQRVWVRMVGDDHYEIADRDDLVKIADLDYCAECGQIGCTHDGREREEA